MGIYDDKQVSLPSINFSFKRFKYPIMAIVGLVIVVALLFSLADVLKPKPLSLSLAPNPLDLTREGQPNSFLGVSVSNISKDTVSSVVVKVEEVGSSKLILFPSSRRIEAMAPGTVQQMSSFVIRPNPAKEINSGSYRLRVSLFIAGEKTAEEDLILAVKAV